MESFHLLTTSAEEGRQVAQSLHEIGCCPRCMLRLLGESRPSSYKLSAQEIGRQLLPADQSLPSTSECPCPACVGILQKFAEEKFLHRILQKVEKEKYEFHDYQCSLILPVSLIVRQRSVFLHLEKKFKDTYSGKEGRISSVKDVWKWTCGYQMAHLLKADFQNRSNFDILLTFNYKNSDKECAFLLDADPGTFRKRKQRKYGFETFTRANVAKAIDEMSDSKFEDCSTCPPPVPVVECTCDITCNHVAVFIAGRYQKYSRELSQTPWLVDGKRIMEGSVQELVCQPILDTFKPSDHRFSSSGREDVDVKMLGSGRPFVVELIDPHCVNFSKEAVADLQKRINIVSKDVQVRDLQIVSREETNKLKEGEIDKTKSYSALCWCDRLLTQEDLNMLAGIKDLKLQQKTPLRVLHRRTVATRERTIHTLWAEDLANNWFRLHLTTQAGTYVKEFVHGDFGRTSPNMKELLKAECDILELDVESVDVDWPPMIDPVPDGPTLADIRRDGQVALCDEGNDQQTDPCNCDGVIGVKDSSDMNLKDSSGANLKNSSDANTNVTTVVEDSRMSDKNISESCVT